VCEVDQRENIDAKRIRLQKLFGAVPDHVTLLAIDFDHEELAVALAARGFAADTRTFFIWEAVTQYLTESAIRATFDFLAKAATGSCLAFTYVRKDFIDGRDLYGQENLYQRFIVKDRIWLFGMDPEGMASFLSSYGWRLVDDLQYEELARRYVKPTGRELSSTPVERIVYAEKL
jgi:methyltransferase (TIGR00027 family)